MKNNGIGHIDKNRSEKIFENAGKLKVSALLPPKTANLQQRRLGVFDGTEGYFMKKDFNHTNEGEFPI